MGALGVRFLVESGDSNGSASVFECFRRHDVVIDLIATSEVSVTVSVDRTDGLDAALSDLRATSQVEVEHPCALVAVVGEGLGGAVGLAVTFGGIRTLVSLAPANLPRLTEVGPSVAVVVFALIVSLVTGVAIGVLPALTAARSPAQEALRESRRTTASKTRRRLRAGLIVAEVSMATALAVPRSTRRSNSSCRCSRAVRCPPPGAG